MTSDKDISSVTCINLHLQYNELHYFFQMPYTIFVQSFRISWFRPPFHIIPTQKVHSYIMEYRCYMYYSNRKYDMYFNIAFYSRRFQWQTKYVISA